MFALAYFEIAEAVGKSPAAVRQIAHRARAHLAARRPRDIVTLAEAQTALRAFQQDAGSPAQLYLLLLCAYGTSLIPLTHVPEKRMILVSIHANI